MNKQGKCIGTTKTHFKMYKKGRSWMAAGIAITSFGLSMFGVGTQTAQADSNTTSESSTTANTAATTSNSTVLKTSHTTETAQITGNSATPGTKPAAESSSSQNQQQADPGAVKKAAATVPTTNTPNDTNATNQADESTAAPTKGDVQVTNLKTADDATYEAAKQTADEAYKTTGVAQEIVRMDDAVAYPIRDGGVLTPNADFVINTTPTGTDIGDGTFGTSNWSLSQKGVLTIGSGELGSGPATSVHANSGENTWSEKISNWAIYQGDIKSIQIDKGVIAPVDASYLFAGLPLVYEIDGLENLDTSKTQDFTGMFEEDNGLLSLDTSKMDTSSATSMSLMFSMDNYLPNLDLSHWDVSKVTNFTSMFWYTRISSLDLSNWNTASATQYAQMFDHMGNLYQITFGPNFTIKPEMPTVELIDEDATNAAGKVSSVYSQNWIGKGDGTIENPTGKAFVNTTYSGEDPDTYYLNGTTSFVFDYVDTTTNKVVHSSEKFSGKIGSEGTYHVAVPKGYTLASDSSQQTDIRYQFGTDSYDTYDIYVDPLKEETFTQTIGTSVTKTDGTQLTKTTGTTTYDLTLVTSIPYEMRGQVEAVNSVTYDSAAAKAGEITDTIPAGYEVSAVKFKETAPNGAVAEMNYNYLTNDASMTSTSIDPTTGKTQVLDYSTLLQPGTTLADMLKPELASILVYDGNKVTVNFLATPIKAGDNLPFASETLDYTITPLPQTLSVNYINQVNNQQVSSDTIKGVTDQSGQYTATAPAGYVFAPGQANTVAYTLAADNTTPIVVMVVPNTGQPADTNPTQNGSTGTGSQAPTTIVGPQQETSTTTVGPQQEATAQETVVSGETSNSGNTSQVGTENTKAVRQTTNKKSVSNGNSQITTNSNQATKGEVSHTKAVITETTQNATGTSAQKAETQKLPQTDEKASAMGALLGMMLLAATSLMGIGLKKRHQD